MWIKTEVCHPFSLETQTHSWVLVTRLWLNIKKLFYELFRSLSLKRERHHPCTHVNTLSLSLTHTHTHTHTHHCHPYPSMLFSSSTHNEQEPFPPPDPLGSHPLLSFFPFSLPPPLRCFLHTQHLGSASPCFQNKHRLILDVWILRA